MSTINIDGSSKISVDKSTVTSSASGSPEGKTQKTSTRAPIINHVDISQKALEKQIEDIEKRIESIKKEILTLTKEASTDKLAQKELELGTLQAQLAALENQSTKN